MITYCQLELHTELTAGERQAGQALRSTARVRTTIAGQRRISSRSISLALIVFLASSTLALAKGRLTGRVLTEAGRGISGVEVILGETDAFRITDR